MKAILVPLLVGAAIVTSACTTSQHKDAPGWAGMASGLRVAYLNDRQLCENKECAKLRTRNDDVVLVKVNGESLLIETHSLIGGWAKSEGSQKFTGYTLHLPPGKYQLTVDFVKRGATARYLRQVEFVAEKGHTYYLYVNEVNADGKHTWNPSIKDSLDE